MNTFHWPGQEHVARQPQPQPKPAPTTQRTPTQADQQRRVVAAELAIKVAVATGDMSGMDEMMHAAYTFERWIVTGIPTVFNGMDMPAANGSHAVQP